MKKRLTFLVLFQSVFAIAQTLSLSEEISIAGADGYGIIGKYNERVLFFLLDDKEVKLRAYDGKLHKLWERELEPERKNNATILEVLGTRQDFNLIYQYRKKNHNYIKIHKYDGQAKMLDSATIYDWGKEYITPKLELLYSEDKKSILIFEILESQRIKALAIDLDSLRPIWAKTIDIKPEWKRSDRFEQMLFNNQAEFYAIVEEDNRIDGEKHRFEITKYSKAGGQTTFVLPMTNMVSIDVKFSFDNVNQQLVAAGLYSAKNFFRAQGHFFIRLPPQYSQASTFTFALHPFDDELASSLLGKKITDTKGLTDLRVQDIVHRLDGGILAIIEQAKIVERRSSTTTNTGRYLGGGVAALGLSMDYFYDNVFALSISPEGKAQWRSIFYKKQISQDDDARFSSYFLVKTPTALRFLFNDEVERSTTVSEFVLNGAGEGERHAIMNTQGQDLFLRFRDAMQIAANEIIVPSDDKRRVRLVKIQY